MKPYKMFGVMLAACVVMTVWPLLVSAQKSGDRLKRARRQGKRERPR